MTDKLRLQYQLSTGSWIDCEDRTEEFLTLCEKTTGKSRDEITDLLLDGKEVRNDSEDWYSNCRDGNTADRIAAELEAEAIAAIDYPEGKKLNCGCIVYYKAHVMSASMGSSCSECYDRMSD